MNLACFSTSDKDEMEAGMMRDPELERQLAAEHQRAIARDVAAFRGCSPRPGVAIGDVARAWLVALQTTESYLRGINVVR
jgi:hypothetical protein